MGLGWWDWDSSPVLNQANRVPKQANIQPIVSCRQKYNYVLLQYSMEANISGSLSELKAIFTSKYATKSLVYSDKSGGNRKILICKDCTMFKVRILKREGDLWEICEMSDDHGTRREDGLVIECMGSRRPSYKDLVEDGAFEALMNSRKITEQKLSIGSIAASMAECLPTAHRPTKDVVKKAVAFNKTKIQLKQLQSKDHVVDISELSSFLVAVKSMNPAFQFQLNNKDGIFENVLVLMPYAAAVMECSYKFIGIDGGHGKEVMVGTDGAVLRKVHIISLMRYSEIPEL